MTKEIKKSYEAHLKVPFYDLDPMQVVWYGNYQKYFSIAGSALFDHMGIDLCSYFIKTNCLFPIVKTSTKHIFPLKYRDEFICKATICDARFKIILDYEIRLAADGKICARGRTEQAAVKAPEMEIMFKIPDEISRALGF